MMQKIFGTRKTKNGTKASCKPEQMDITELGKMLKRIQILEEGRVQPKRQRTGESREKRKELRGRSIRSCYTILTWKA